MFIVDGWMRAHKNQVTWRLLSVYVQNTPVGYYIPSDSPERASRRTIYERSGAEKRYRLGDFLQSRSSERDVRLLHRDSQLRARTFCFGGRGGAFFQ